MKCETYLRHFVLLLATIVGGGINQRVLGEGSPQYNRDILPILAENCFACHGADAESREADLRLDQREAAIDYGAIVPGEVDESVLIDRILSDDPDLIMPPKDSTKSLTEEQKQHLIDWIAAGAKYQGHWSFIVPTRPKVPAVKNTDWPKNDIDRFTLARLEARGLTPAPEANPRTLFRRLHLDITGLPPAPRGVTKFVAEYEQRGDAALSEWTDRLMESKAWGEHRARYWLDAARYGDTHGLHFDNYREMWPYRDWVIRAFNNNQPFDKFTIDQLAGDLLPEPTNDQLVATGFQRCNITTNEGGTIAEENLANYAADRVQTFGWVYLGLTTNCCQCHDHKFDPLTMRDYYSLAAYFRNTTQGALDGNSKDGRGPVLYLPSEANQPRWKALPGEIQVATASRDARKKEAKADFDLWLASTTADSVAQRVPSEGLALHVPLDDGEDDKARIAIGDVESAVGTGEIAWLKNGKLGAAPIVSAGNTLEVGDVGNFERDQAFSYGAWVRPARNNMHGAIIARMDERSKYRGWDLWYQNGSFGTHIIDSWPDNALKVLTRKAIAKPTKWQHVFVTYDGSGTVEGIKVYVDGQSEPLKTERNDLAADASIRTSTPLRIGQRSHAAVFEGGAIQDVRIYDRQLTEDEVKAIQEYTNLQGLLGIPEEKRKPGQAKELFDFYLVNFDKHYTRLVNKVHELEAEKEAIRSRSPLTHVQREREDSPAMAHILMRGAYDKPGEEVEAAPPAALHPNANDAPRNRLGLAKWVVDPANSLTSRVTVNRFWQQVFGRGIVATPEDFGVMGAPPSHPELLDWLAVEFRSSGWDVKRFFKLMLMSATYRQAAITTPERLEKDRDNVLLSRGPRFRMDAEMVRDYALASSGLLSTRMFGPGTRPYQPVGVWDVVGLPGGDTRDYKQDHGENLYRRSLYTFWKRMAPPPNLEAFNAPSREVCTVRRERTNTPLQALVALNDPLFVEAARTLAQRAMKDTEGMDSRMIDFIAQRILCRPMREEEIAIVQASKQELLNYYQSNSDDAQALIAVGESKTSDDLDAAELATWTMICNQIMNLDEALNK